MQVGAGKRYTLFDEGITQNGPLLRISVGKLAGVEDVELNCDRGNQSDYSTLSLPGTTFMEHVVDQ